MVTFLFGRRLPTPIDLSLMASLCLLWPILGITWWRGYLRTHRIFVTIMYLFLFIAYLLNILLRFGIAYSFIINTSSSIFLTMLPIIYFRSFIDKKYSAFAFACVLWFSAGTYFYPQLPQQFNTYIFIFSFFLTIIAIKKVLEHLFMQR
jgi:hypothetical protein